LRLSRNVSKITPKLSFCAMVKLSRRISFATIVGARLSRRRAAT
jgi:hypothetical protein